MKPKTMGVFVQAKGWFVPNGTNHPFHYLSLIHLHNYVCM